MGKANTTFVTKSGLVVADPLPHNLLHTNLPHNLLLTNLSSKEAQQINNEFVHTYNMHTCLSHGRNSQLI